MVEGAVGVITPVPGMGVKGRGRAERAGGGQEEGVRLVGLEQSGVGVWGWWGRQEGVGRGRVEDMEGAGADLKVDVP